MTVAVSLKRAMMKRPANSEYANIICYHDNMSRFEAEEILSGLPTGAYVLRDSYEFPNDLALSLVSEDCECQVDRRPKKEMKHYRIDTTKGFRVRGPNEKTFPSLQGLLKHYTEAQHGLSTQLQIPIICNALFHMVEVWEFQNTSGMWEPFTLDQMLSISTLHEAEDNYHITFEDHTSVNLKTMLRILPGRYTPPQKIRYRPCYAFCEECSNNRRSDSPTSIQNNNIDDTNFCPKFRNCSSTTVRTTPSKYRYIIWEYYVDEEWIPLRPSVQKLLVSYHLLWSSHKEENISHVFTIFDDHQYIINLRQNKITVKGHEVATIRKRELYALSSEDLHHEKSNYLKMKNQQAGKRVKNYLHRVYCNASDDSMPTTWEKSSTITSHIFASSSEYKNVCSQLPDTCHKRIRSISRIQRPDLWRLYTKERKLLQLNIGDYNVKEEIMWSQTSLKNEADAKSLELMDTLTAQGVQYFTKITEVKNSAPLILCKVLLEALPLSDVSEQTCIVDDILNPHTVQMSCKITDRVYPLYLVFFTEGDNNMTMIEKTCDKR